jgi:hypothetical protein
MMTRSGFVSNSSSSSFICAICGEIESGRDASLLGFDMVSCEKGHEFHIDCLKEPEELKKILEDAEEREGEEDEDGKDYEEYLYELPSKYCPICNFEEISDKDLLRYLMRNSLKSDILQEIRERFKTYEDFRNGTK